MKQIISKSLFVFPLLTAGMLQAQEKTAHLNLVFIMADQWRGDALGCLGREPVKTPCLDRLASEGVVFSNSISSYPVSSPARGMLMSGMYPVANKITGNCNSANAPYNVELPENVRCWSDVLKDKAYQTAYIGKWHLDSPHEPYVNTANNKGKIAWNEWCPKERRHGFDHWIAYGTYDQHLHPMYWSTDAPRDSFYYVNQWGPEYEADQAIVYLNSIRQANKPFALVVSMNPPHFGYELVPDKYKTLYKDLDVEALCAGRPDIPPKGTSMGEHFRTSIPNYYACISGVDEQIGRIVSELKRLNLFDNTIIVVTSDHGTDMGTHDNIGKNTFHEMSMRIPMIITWPEKLEPRRDDKTMIAFADLYPTLLSLMGFRNDIPAEVQTFDLSAALLKGEERAEVIQPYYRIEPSNIRTGYRGLRMQRYTFAIHATDGKQDEMILFDRQTDPWQLENIAGRNPDLVKKFSNQLKEWLEKTDDPFVTCIE
ncbi:MAG: sulfatase [Parabacteroides sp.]|nr:sulfatase [Parabacteroides sp.]